MRMILGSRLPPLSAAKGLCQPVVLMDKCALLFSEHNQLIKMLRYTDVSWIHSPFDI